MDIEYLGHSAFLLKGENFSVVTDPFSGIGYEMKRVDCDYVLSSHSHFDHNAFDAVNARKIVTLAEGVFTCIPCWHDEVCGKKRGENNAFFFNMDGLNILHLGDFGEPFTKENAKKFASLKVDVLFIPIGGTYTIDAIDAYEYAKVIGARLTIGMHFKTKKSKIDIALPEEFISISNATKVGNRLSVTLENISNLPKTVVMDGEF